VIVQASCHGTDNRAMLDCIASDPKRYRGVAIVDDGFGEADYDRLDAGGVRGVRFNFVKHLGGAPDMAVFNRVIDRIKDRDWHVVLHLDAPDIVPLSPMIRARPLSFVIDHMGRVPAAAGVDQPGLRALIELSALENCWIKVCGAERISMPPYAAAVPIARALVEAVPTRVLWGTDFPHPNATHAADEADLVDLVLQFAATPLAQQRLLVDNPARLYGFGS
jgi:2-pyrone-4,6-dicarboxylate lactonase